MSGGQLVVANIGVFQPEQLHATVIRQPLPLPPLPFSTKSSPNASQQVSDAVATDTALQGSYLELEGGSGNDNDEEDEDDEDYVPSTSGDAESSDDVDDDEEDKEDDGELIDDGVCHVFSHPFMYSSDCLIP
jgi:hypothetical protein